MSAKTHGRTRTPEYSVWTDIKTRCYNENFKDFQYYGGKGIKVCHRWLESFENFLSDMGERPSAQHSIDRINPDLDYEHGNCRWATASEQANNKTTTIFVTLGCVTKSLGEWCAERGVEYGGAWLRYKDGLRGEALFVPRCTHLTHAGITDTIAGWSKRTKIKATTITMRVNKLNWSVAEALTKGSSCL